MKPEQFLIPLAVASVFAPLWMAALRAMRSGQNVSAHLAEHAHKQGTPTMGGMIMLVAMLVGCAVSIPAPYNISALALVLGFGAVGFIDDYVVPRRVQGSRGLGWKPKLAMQVAASVGSLWLSGFREVTPFLIGVFLLLFMSNAYNFADGLDALAGGLGVILAGTLGLWAWATGNTAIAIAMGVLGVGFLPFLAFNRPKAKVFMGDVGALPIGALFGWAFLLLGTNAQGQIMPAAFWPLLVISIVMLIELIPVPLQIASVKLRGKRMFEFKTPVHHGFQSAGWLEPRIVAMFYLVQLAVSAVGLAMFAPTRPYAPYLAAGLLLILVLSPWRWSQWAKDKVKPVEPAPQAAPGEA